MKFWFPKKQRKKHKGKDENFGFQKTENKKKAKHKAQRQKKINKGKTTNVHQLDDMQQE